MIEGPVSWVPLQDRSQARLSIGDRIFQRNGSIVVFNPLYNIELTDPKEQLRLRNSNVSKSQMLPKLNRSQPHENSLPLAQSQIIGGDYKNDFQRPEIPQQEDWSHYDQPLTKSLMIKKNVLTEQGSQLLTRNEIEKHKRMDQFYHSNEQFNETWAKNYNILSSLEKNRYKFRRTNQNIFKSILKKTV